MAAVAPAERPPPETLVIRPPGRLTLPDLPELWRFRELLFYLAWRDIKIRYKQTALGAAWAILQPFLTMIVFTLFFGRLAGIKAPDDIPYPLFSLTGLVLWTYFANAVTFTSNSLVGNAALITKVYFPRLAIAVSPVLAGIVDFLLAASVLGAVMGWYGYAPPLRILLAPCFLLLAMLTALGVGLWLSALNVRYRDVRYAVPFIIQLWLFATPVAYPPSLVGGSFAQLVLGLNPMAGVIEGFRWALLGADTSIGPLMVGSIVVVAIGFVGGIAYFRRMEKHFADLL
ncbi:MAG: lipopolysaccharide transport system permease protein [Gaiellaceae bacterium]|nr:lipopolysaccharide transport system permease protein [Gaiellaceae bacterium]